MDNMCAQCTLSNGLHSHLCVPRQGATAMSEDCHSSDNAVPTTEVQIKLKDALNRMMFVRKCADLLLEKWAAQPYGVPTTEQRLEATMLINLSEEIAQEACSLQAVDNGDYDRRCAEGMALLRQEQEIKLGEQPFAGCRARANTPCGLCRVCNLSGSTTRPPKVNAIGWRKCSSVHWMPMRQKRCAAFRGTKSMARQPK